MKVKSQYVAQMPKFGIEIPKSVKRALEVDAKTGTNFWRAAIKKEMKNCSMAIEILPNSAAVPVGYTQIRCHMIFDFKIDFTRKARFVAGGHLTNPPKQTVYSSIITLESAQIFFLICALKLACNVQNTYLNTKKRKEFVCGWSRTWCNVGKPVLIIQALYGHAQ